MRIGIHIRVLGIITTLYKYSNKKEYYTVTVTTDTRVTEVHLQ